jgi:hypothetical protein
LVSLRRGALWLAFVPAAAMMTFACSSILGLRDDYELAGDDGATRGPGDGPVPGDETTVPDPPEVRGTLTVHVRPVGVGDTAVHVLVGDGVKIPPQRATGDTVAFKDPSLFGPQDVTVVRVRTGASYRVTTLLGVKSAELWFGQSPVYTPRGNVAYRVSGMSDTANNIDVASTRDGYRILPPQNAAGLYTSKVEGTAPGRMSFVAYEWAGIEYTLMMRVGQANDIPVAEGSTTDAGTVALTHAFNKTSFVSLRGTNNYGSEVRGSVLYYPQPPPRPSAFTSSDLAAPVDAGPGRYQVRLPAIDMTPPFDTWTRFVEGTVSQSVYANPDGKYSTIRQVFEPSNTIEFHAPPTITAPRGDGGAVSRANLAVEYADVAPGAQLVSVELAGRSSDPLAKYFEWTAITANKPDGRGKFVPFVLPADIAPVTLPAGTYQVEVKALSSSDALTAEQLLGTQPGMEHVDDVIERTRVRTEIAANTVSFSLL